MSSRPLILAVDDDEKLLKLLTVNLIAEGFQVMTASNGVQAMKFLEGVPPDLVLLDISMPVMDGFETLMHIREQSEVPVIMLTAADDPTTTSKAMRAGADDFMSKPFSIRELLARVHAKLRRYAILNSSV